MAYLDHQHTHKRIAGVAGVALIHVVLAAGLVVGLAVDAIIEETDKRLVLLPVQPPKVEPLPPEPVPTENAYAPPSGPVAPIDLGTSSPITIVEDTFIDRPIDLVIPPPGDLPIGPARPPEPPASAFTPRAPAPSNGPAGWVTNNDYPRVSIVREQEGDVGYALDVNAEGRVEGCRIIMPSGFDALDRATCRLIERRARFRPATDNTGAAVAGTWRGTVSWTIPEN